VLKTSSSGIRTLPDGVTGAYSNRCTNYLYLCMSLTFYEIKSNTRLSIKLPRTPELAYDCFRTVMSATSNLNDNNNELVEVVDNFTYISLNFNYKGNLSSVVKYCAI